MKRLVIDLDGTLTIDDPGLPYPEKLPNLALIEMVREYKIKGFDVIIYSARSMRTYEASIGKINANTLPVIIDWLRLHNVPFDELHIGKPWCGENGFYVDDRAIRPDEFLKLTLPEIHCLLGGTAADPIGR